MLRSFPEQHIEATATTTTDITEIGLLRGVTSSEVTDDKDNQIDTTARNHRLRQFHQGVVFLRIFAIPSSLCTIHHPPHTNHTHTDTHRHKHTHTHKHTQTHFPRQGNRKGNAPARIPKTLRQWLSRGMEAPHLTPGGTRCN